MTRSITHVRLNHYRYVAYSSGLYGDKLLVVRGLVFAISSPRSPACLLMSRVQSLAHNYVCMTKSSA